jgi:hypothetical protein
MKSARQILLKVIEQLHKHSPLSTLQSFQKISPENIISSLNVQTQYNLSENRMKEVNNTDLQTDHVHRIHQLPQNYIKMKRILDQIPYL